MATPAKKNANTNVNLGDVFGVTSALQGSGQVLSFGPVMGLNSGPSGSLAGTSAKQVFDNMLKYNKVSNVVSIISGLTVKTYATFAEVQTDAEKMLNQFGSMNGGVVAGLEQMQTSGLGGVGNYDPSTKRGAKPAPSVIIGSGGDALSAATAATKLNALDTLKNDLQQWGLEDLTNFVYQETMGSTYKPAADVINELRTGTGNAKGKPAEIYNKRFPGMAERAKAGLPPITENQYQTLEQSYMDTAREFGLPKGFVGPEEIGKLIGSGVSATEFNDRVNNGYRVAATADPNVKETLQQYYGVDKGHLAAYYLNPAKAYDVLLKQTQAAVVGGIAKDTGFAGVNQNTAEQIAAQMIGSPASMDANAIRGGMTRAAQLQPLETQTVGQRGQATVNAKQIVSAAFPGMTQPTGTTVAGDAASIRLAEEARTAGLSGGGGMISNAKGVVGVGRAGSEGYNTTA